MLKNCPSARVSLRTQARYSIKFFYRLVAIAWYDEMHFVLQYLIMEGSEKCNRADVLINLDHYEPQHTWSQGKMPRRTRTRIIGCSS